MNRKHETDQEIERGKIGAFVDWVNADSPDIPAEIEYEHEEHHGEHHEEHHEEKTPQAQIRQERKMVSWMYRGGSLVCGLLLVAILLFTVQALPRFGEREVPAFNEVSQRYLEEGLTETGAVNVVAGIILDYRAFDTLGESMVLFTGSIAVIFLLTQLSKKAEGEEDGSKKCVESLPAQVIIRMVFPIVLLYGIYVVFNGHISPGGGFSGGTILGAGLILCHLAFGEAYTSRFVTVKRCTGVMSVALLTYIAMKTYSILTGANHIESGIPLGTPGSIFSSGLIFPLNICVGLVVACTIFAVYSLFTNWKAREK
ncbi:MAG: hydrogen gas-evolving membrane-bound hydrogenase subunit E [Roseburia sp.]